MRYFSDVAALARKDLLIELRAKETVPAMFLFVISALTIFHFSVPTKGISTHAEHEVGLGLLWTAIIFTALLGLTRAFVPEREQGLFDALVMAPCDRSAIWLGKAISVFAFLVLAELVALPAFGLFFFGVGWRTVAAVLLANVGICAVGTLTGAMAVAGRARELILPLLFLPMSIPIVVGGVGASILSNSKYLAFLGLYDAVFVLLAWGAFEYVVAET
ncbi:MAG TPA: heme exporter protein CcmB [Gaiellaceae bacterium]|jgi:heme exporter protein B|nr:heme exporter protein CcmB [Gaiellaceae bacterium]